MKKYLVIALIMMTTACGYTPSQPKIKHVKSDTVKTIGVFWSDSLKRPILDYVFIVHLDTFKADTKTMRLIPMRDTLHYTPKLIPVMRDSVGVSVKELDSLKRPVFKVINEFTPKNHFIGVWGANIDSMMSVKKLK